MLHRILTFCVRERVIVLLATLLVIGFGGLKPVAAPSFDHRAVEMDEWLVVDIASYIGYQGEHGMDGLPLSGFRSMPFPTSARIR